MSGVHRSFAFSKVLDVVGETFVDDQHGIIIQASQFFRETNQMAIQISLS